MKFSKLRLLASTLAISFGLNSLAQAEAKVDTALPEYHRASGVAGNLSSVGSDTLANLMTLWAESFKKT